MDLRKEEKMKQYNDKYIIAKIINYKYTYQDLNPKQFGNMIHGSGLYCPFHANSRTGTMQARLYYHEEKNLWYIHCYAEGKNFFASDYVDLILCRERQLFKSPKDFLLSKMSQEEFISLYNLFNKQKQEHMESAWERKRRWIDNVYNETGNAIDYIETLYTS